MQAKGWEWKISQRRFDVVFHAICCCNRKMLKIHLKSELTIFESSRSFRYFDYSHQILQHFLLFRLSCYLGFLCVSPVLFSTFLFLSIFSLELMLTACFSFTFSHMLVLLERVLEIFPFVFFSLCIVFSSNAVVVAA